MSLKDRLQADLTAAMKARDDLRTATLRMTLAAITNEEVAGTQARELTDEEVVRVLTREHKKRGEAAEAFAAAGRTELAERERAEAAVLESYLPAQLDDAELRSEVERAIAEVGAQPGADGMRSMGAVMKILTARLAGRADGARIAAEVRRQLTG